jgi:Biotin/lipoate A/B protein ligase family
MPSPSRTPASRQVDLPPPFQLVRLREVGDAFRHATTIAAEAGAGTLVYVGRFDLAEFAIVLEPDAPLRRARRVFYAGMVALRDALVAQAPPERPITFAWPDAIHVDGGLLGGGRLGWPADSAESATPDWLVFGASIRTVGLGEGGAGLHALATALDEEGFEDAGSDRLIESFTRHLMVAIDAWRANEFATVIATYLAQLTVEKGALPTLADNGDLLLKWRGQREPDRHDLAAALAVPSWLDPATGGPRA